MRLEEPVLAAPAMAETLLCQQVTGRKQAQQQQQHHQLHPCRPLPVAQPDWRHTRDRLQVLTISDGYSEGKVTNLCETEEQNVFEVNMFFLNRKPSWVF